MHNNSLVNLLKSFSPKEISDFKDFLISPYFNKKNSVIKLYEIIKKHYPDFNDESISKKNIHSKLFPGKVFNDNNLRVLTHNLNELAKKFITYRNFENNKTEFDYRQLQELMNKQQFNYLDKRVSKLSASLEAQDLNADEYNFQKFRLEYENIFFLSISHVGLFEKFLDKADFEKVFNYFSAYYYLKSIRLYINVLNLQIIYKKEFDTENFKRMISLIDESVIKGNPVIEIFYCIIKLFDQSDGEKYYFRAKKILKQIGNTLHFDDISEIYINLTNYCNRKIYDNIKKFEIEKFELYKEENELKLYVLNGCMSPVYYKNLVILALSLKEFSWVKDFILNYKHELPEDTRENLFTYCMSLYEFDMKNFEKSLELLSKIKYDELYLKYDSKILQLMIYYEMKSEEPLIASMEAFRHFLSNNKLLPDNKKELYTNFYKFFNKIVNFNFNLNLKRDKIEIERLKIKISGSISVFNKAWIAKKINSLSS